MVETFEREFAEFCSTRHAVGLASGTDAVRFALMAAGIGAGEIVVTVPNTFIATTEAISQAGARPVFVDIEEQTYNMDPAKLQDYLENGCDHRNGKIVDRKLKVPVTAVVPVHLYGQMADMDAILEIAANYKLAVIEDACQAHGAEYFSRKTCSWHRAGSMGKAAAFSFYPGKNLGACGEAGAVTTNDPDIASKIKMLRDHGQAKKYYHSVEGYNGRLDAIQAGILSVKLKSLAEWNEARRERAATYNELFAEAEHIITPFEPSWSKAVYHLYVVRSKKRDQLRTFCDEAKIGTAIHYPVPLHMQQAYSNLGYLKGDFPISEEVADEIVSLPMFPQLTAEQQQRVVERVLEFASAATVGAGL
jgi:dTDP-4-amino-4,6-dideoxygalactose transaminase